MIHWHCHLGVRLIELDRRCRLVVRIPSYYALHMVSMRLHPLLEQRFIRMSHKDEGHLVLTRKFPPRTTENKYTHPIFLHG